MTIDLPPSSPFGASILPTEYVSSHWQRSVKDDPLVLCGKDDPLPATADVVIIGSGMSGAVTAYSLLSAPYPPKSVVVLEAREICSGATGRNGGHCRPDAFRGYNAFSKLHGPVEAKKILESEAITLNNVAAFVKEYNVDCELREFTDYVDKAYQDAANAGVNVTGVKRLSAEETQQITQSPNAFGGYQWTAASVNPAKLNYGVHRVCQSFEGYSLFAFTPVTAVEPNSDETRPWTAVTPRGSIKTTKVVYATNGYSPLILPDVANIVSPFKAQAVKINSPPLGLEVSPPMAATMSLRHQLHHFYSVASQPDESVVLCCSRIWADQTPEEYKALFGTYDDSVPSVPRGKDTFKQFCSAIPGGGYDPEPFQEGQDGLDFQWAGIIAFTPDHVPLVGPLPGKEGQYIIAGFNGHGMARIFHCAPCLAAVVLGGMEKWDRTVPLAFQTSTERFERLRTKATTF